MDLQNPGFSSLGGHLEWGNGACLLHVAACPRTVLSVHGSATNADFTAAAQVGHSVVRHSSFIYLSKDMLHWTNPVYAYRRNQ